MIYRNCEIDVECEQSLGGWEEVYWSAFDWTGYEITSGFGGGTIEEMTEVLKREVDQHIDALASGTGVVASNHDE